MVSPEQRRFEQPISYLRQQLEMPIKFGLERCGFVRVEENTNIATKARLGVMRSLWALKGFDYLLDLTPADDRPTSDVQTIDPRLIALRRMNANNNWEQIQDPTTYGIMRRINAIPKRRDLLQKTLNQAFSIQLPESDVLTARKRLENMCDVWEGKTRKPTGSKRAVILDQNSHLIASTKLPYGFDAWLDSAAKIGGSALPVLGEAILYSHLKMTG